MLRLRDGGEYERLRRLGTVVEVTLKEEQGREVCRTSGALSAWTLAWSRVGPGAYWQRACAEVRLEPGTAYHVTATVGEVDMNPFGPTVDLVLQGGGKDSLETRRPRAHDPR